MNIGTAEPEQLVSYHSTRVNGLEILTPSPTKKDYLRFGPFGRDDPRAEVHILDAGHFALDLKPKEVIRLMGDFERHLPSLFWQMRSMRWLKRL